MVDITTGETKSTEKTTIMRKIGWPPATNKLKLINLLKGKYRLEIDIQTPKTDSTMATWYYSGKVSRGLVEKIEDAQIINITSNTLEAHFRDGKSREGRH